MNPAAKFSSRRPHPDHRSRSKWFRLALSLPVLLSGSALVAQPLSLPARPAHAPDGDAFARQITGLDLAQRDQAVADAFLGGNAPEFLRRLCPVSVTNVTAGVTNTATFFVTPDYLAVGADENYFLAPISPAAAQRIADQLDCLLPTRKMVNAIYAAAPVKLPPSPIPPGPAMTTVPVFMEHNQTVRAQRMARTNDYPLGTLVAGHQKDVVISARLATVTNRVAIYGWHQTNGAPIQPLYLGHVAGWVDYSQCLRLVSQNVLVNGVRENAADVLADPKLCALLSDEGVVARARYATNEPAPPVEIISQPWPQKFVPATHFSEWRREIVTADGVRILLNAPAPENFASNRPVQLVFYALPNGNTIEQTLGKRPAPGEDWHFDLQHIGAQTRWLRQVLTNGPLVVAYLEAPGHGWPAWRKTHEDRQIMETLDHLRQIFAAYPTTVTLASHSGGGSLVFGYLNTVTNLPDDLTRLAFLDSDYGYDTARHAEKIKRWLAASSGHRLCVLAYQDYLAQLNGRPFVSENGGTWGRSHALLRDLAKQFPFTSRTNAGLETFSSADGRIEFRLKENPDQKIWHTVQVERNGFIEALLSGTALAGKGYDYLGDRAYSTWIE